MPAPQVYIGSFLLTSKLQVLERAVNIPPGFHHTDFSQYSDLIAFIKKIPMSIIFVSAVSREDLVTLSKLSVEVKGSPNQVRLVLMGNRHINVKKVAEKLGIEDVVEADATPRSLRYKLNAWVTSYRPQDKSKPDVEVAAESSPTRIVATEKATFKNTPRLLPGLDCPDDMWLLRSKFDCTFSLNKWFLKLIGPSPYVGRWVKRGRTEWEFKFKEEQNEFCSPAGSWFFKGNHRPDYVWKDNHWLFASDQFELYYQCGDEKLIRASLKNREMVITENSEFAKNKHKLIVESFTNKSSEQEPNTKNLNDVEPEDVTFLKRSQKVEAEEVEETPIKAEAFEESAEEAILKTRQPLVGLDPVVPMKKTEEEFVELIETAKSAKETEQASQESLRPVPVVPAFDERLKDLLQKAAKQYKAGA